MKTTNNAAADLIAAISAMTPEQAQAFAAIAAEVMETPAEPKAKKAKKPAAPKAPRVEYRRDKAGRKIYADGIEVNGEFFELDSWVTYMTADGPHMGKAKNLPADAASIEQHANQGKALQRINAMKAEPKPAPKAKKAPKAAAPKAKAPKTAPKAAAKAEAPAPVIAPKSDDLDALAARRDAKNAAIIATIPQAKRKGVENKLAQLHKAGYRYARLERNKRHQLDGLHIYPGAKGHGRDDAFRACMTQKAQAWRERADKARAAGKPAPKPVAGQFVWSPVGGGNLYARGIFGPIAES